MIRRISRRVVVGKLPKSGCAESGGLGGGADSAVLGQLDEQFVRLLRALAVLVLDLLDELLGLVTSLRVLQELVVDLCTLQGVVLNRDKVVDEVRRGGAALAHRCHSFEALRRRFGQQGRYPAGMGENLTLG